MPVPFAAEVSLTDEQRQSLERIVRAASTPQSLAFRARIVLRAAEPDRPPNLQIAVELGCSRHTAALWRDRFLEQGLPGLQDAPRSGRPPRVSPLDAG
jgi:transposase